MNEETDLIKTIKILENEYQLLDTKYKKLLNMYKKRIRNENK